MMIGPMIMMEMMKTVAFILKKFSHRFNSTCLNCKTKCRSNLKQSSFLHLFLCVHVVFFFVEVPRRSHLKTVSIPNLSLILMIIIYYRVSFVSFNNWQDLCLLDFERDILFCNGRWWGKWCADVSFLFCDWKEDIFFCFRRGWRCLWCKHQPTFFTNG